MVCASIMLASQRQRALRRSSCAALMFCADIASRACASSTSAVGSSPTSTSPKTRYSAVALGFLFQQFGKTQRILTAGRTGIAPGRQCGARLDEVVALECDQRCRQRGIAGIGIEFAPACGGSTGSSGS